MISSAGGSAASQSADKISRLESRDYHKVRKQRLPNWSEHCLRIQASSADD